MSKKSIIIITVLAIVIVITLGLFMYFKGPRLENNLPAGVGENKAMPAPKPSVEMTPEQAGALLKKMEEAVKSNPQLGPMTEKERQNLLKIMAEASDKNPPLSEAEKDGILKRMKGEI